MPESLHYLVHFLIMKFHLMIANPQCCCYRSFKSMCSYNSRASLWLQNCYLYNNCKFQAEETVISHTQCTNSMQNTAQNVLILPNSILLLNSVKERKKKKSSWFKIESFFIINNNYLKLLCLHVLRIITNAMCQRGHY